MTGGVGAGSATTSDSGGNRTSTGNPGTPPAWYGNPVAGGGGT